MALQTLFLLKIEHICGSNRENNPSENAYPWIDVLTRLHITIRQAFLSLFVADRYTMDTNLVDTATVIPSTH